LAGVSEAPVATDGRAAATLGAPAELLARFPRLTPPVSTARAAVTIVLRQGSGDVEVLLIERAENPTDPASGHVALPGGRVDPRDGSLADTALRELEEEVGIPPSDVLASLRFVRTETARRFGMDVGIFAAELPMSASPPTARSAVEVAHVFWLPRRSLSETRPTPRMTPSGTVTVNATHHDGHVLWGFTRRVLRQFFALPTEDEALGTPFPAHAPPEPPDGPPTL
jgi:8-oxo-dGTP pyrophosphatase MutT (NUDIX family)